MPEEGPDAVTLAAFSALVVLAGGNAVAIFFSNAELAPFWGGTLRFALAAAVFVAYAVARRARFPRGRAMLGAVLYGAVGFGAAFAFVYWGIQHVAPGTAQVLLALVPLFTFALGVLQRQEPFRWRGVIGALLALAGVTVVFREQFALDVPIVGLAAVLAGSVCFAEAALLVKRFPRGDIVTTNGAAMAVGASLLLAASFAAREPHAVPSRPTTWLAIGFLALVGSVAVFALFLFVLHRWTASAASYQFVLIPFVTLAVSTVLTGERLTWGLAAGALLVVAGVYVGALFHGSTPRPRRLASRALSRRRI